MRGFVLAFGPVVASLCLLHCSSDATPALTPVVDAGMPDVVTTTPPPTQTPPDAGPATIVDPPLVPANKVDLLFVVDNSASMGDKQESLSAEIDRLFKALPAKDIHVGVISSSLGEGGDICAVDENHPHGDDHAHLLNKALDGTVVPGAENGFLSFGAGGIADLPTLEQKTAALIKGVDEVGCGFEVQLEAMYRFVSMPDPPLAITIDPFSEAQYSGIDFTLLAQRKAFFRPDSAVAIVMLSDEDDGSLDARAIGGFGYAFGTRSFPGSKVARGTTAQGTTAPEGTSVCATTPQSPDCSSCGFAASCDEAQASCQKLRADSVCGQSNDPGQTGAGYNGFYGAADDDLNVRMFDMKQRYGVDPRYPYTRYVQGLTSRRLPDSKTEHTETTASSGQRTIGDYVQGTNCTNPLFATNLPANVGDELCNLQDNARSSKLVFFGFVGGVPPTLLANGLDWTKIVGANPDAYDFTGIDVHMIPSITARLPLTGSTLPRGQNGTDPVNGREWNTQKKDLQYACTFALKTPRDCAQNIASCDCSNDPNGGTPPNPPLCKADGTAIQTRGKAYPTTRELYVAKALGDRAVVGSLCDVDATSGYGAFLDAFAAKVTTGLAK